MTPVAGEMTPTSGPFSTTAIGRMRKDEHLPEDRSPLEASHSQRICCGLLYGGPDQNSYCLLPGGGLVGGLSVSRQLGWKEVGEGMNGIDYDIACGMARKHIYLFKHRIPRGNELFCLPLPGGGVYIKILAGYVSDNIGYINGGGV